MLPSFSFHLLSVLKHGCTLTFRITSSRNHRILMELTRFNGYKLFSFFLSCIPLNVVLYLNELQLSCLCYIRCGLHINPEARHTHLIDLCQSTVFIHRSIMFISKLYTEPEVKQKCLFVVKLEKKKSSPCLSLMFACLNISLA